MKKEGIFRPCESDKLRVRRHVALASLAVQVLFVLAMLCLYFLGSDKTAAIISASIPVMVIIITGLNSMTLMWFKAASDKDKSNADG